MGRRRRRINEHLPQYVYRKGKGFIYRRHGKDTYLCRQDAPMSELWAAYERVTNPREEGTLGWLLRTYFELDHYRSRAEPTRKEYRAYARILSEFRTADGSPFAQVRLEQVTRRTIASYLRKYPAPIAANRQIQFLKAAWNQVLQFHDIPDNPCIGVTLNKQEARDRYVSQEEFQAFKSTTRGYLPVFMELAYLLRARWSEVAGLATDDLLREGVRLVRTKGSETEITAWSPRLVAAVEAAKALHPRAPTPISGTYLVHDSKGRPINRNAFQSAWGRAMRAWVAKGNQRFTFHDLKAAGISDQKDNYGGHRSASMRRVYVRKPQIVQPPE